MQHTPGPWEVRHKRSVHPVGRGFVAVAVAEQHDKNHEANARLIAASPELLAELERLYQKYGLLTTADVIAKATGVCPKLET